MSSHLKWLIYPRYIASLKLKKKQTTTRIRIVLPKEVALNSSTVIALYENIADRDPIYCSA